MPGRTIVFVGGGSFGHIAPSVAAWEELKKKHPDAAELFVCANRSDEIAFLTAQKLRFQAFNLPRGGLFPFMRKALRAVTLFFSALSLLTKEKPVLVFSKGGFLSVPFCLAAKIKKIPIVLHESDAVMGRANAFLARFVDVACTGFPLAVISGQPFEALRPSGPNGWSVARQIFTGNPVRVSILQGSRDAGKRITGFSLHRPVLMIIGGSQGAKAINEAVREQLPRLLEVADVIHITGSGKGDAVMRHAHYFTREMVTHELKDLYAIATLVVTRAGAGALSELAALRKPAIVVPLAGVGHDHQNENARRLVATGAIEHLSQENTSSLSDVVKRLLANPERMAVMGENLHEFFPVDAAERIAEAVSDALTG